MGIRLVGLSRALFELFPPDLTAAYLLVTWLGDTLVLTGLLAVLYWLGSDRTATLTVVGYGFVGFAAIVGLKGLFAMPRPEAALIEAHGYGFPSGHALGSTMVYGGMAIAYGWLDDRRKTAGVAVLVALVALSRVALRVHYLGDVLVGAAVGLVALGATARLADDPRTTFVVATVLAVPALVVAGASADAWGVLGGCLGGLVAATYLDRVPPLSGRREAAALLAVGLPAVLAARLTVAALPAAPGVPALDELVIVVVVGLLPLAFERTGVREWLAA